MGTSSSKSPEELYSHIVNASASLFKSLGKHWQSENDSRFMKFFAEYSHALERGELAFDNDIHVKHAGIELSRMDFTAFIIKNVGDNAKTVNSQSGAEAFDTLQKHFAKFTKIKDLVKPEIVRSHLIASWILHDGDCDGEVQLRVVRDEVIGKMEVSPRLKENIEYKLRHIPKARRGHMATDEDLIPFSVMVDIFDQLGIWRELDVYWRMNFDNDKEARVKGNFLTAFEFAKFLKNVQMEAGTLQEILRHSEHLATAFGGTVDRHSFIRFLTDPELNPVIDFEKFNSVYHDMKSHPLPNYFIASSFRTYLAGSGAAYSGLCSVDRYRQVLTGQGGFIGEEASFSPATKSLVGNNNVNNNNNNFATSALLNNDDPNSSSSTYHSCARFIEVDVWENAHGIKETYTLGAGKNTREATFVVGPDVTCPNNLSLTEVLTTIRDSAFVKSPFPVIISIQFTNMSLENQKLLAEELKRGLGGERRIFCPNTDEDNPLVEPSSWTPDALKGMFILVGRPRRSATSTTAAAVSASKQPIIGNQTSIRTIATIDHTNGGVTTSTVSSSSSSQMTQDDITGVAPELHSLFFLHAFMDSNPTAIVGNAFDRDHEAPKNFQNDPTSRCAVRSLTDDVAAGFAMTHPKSVAQVSFSNFIRIIPSRDKWRKTMNFPPHPAWEAGAQIVSLFWQNDPHGDDSIRLYRSRFSDNGKCGFLLRSDALLKSKLPPEFFPKNSKSSVVPSSATSKSAKSLSQQFEQHQKFTVSILSAFCLPQPRSKLFDNEETVNPYVIVKLEGPGHAPNRVLLRSPTCRDNSFHPSWVTQLSDKIAKDKRHNDLVKNAMLDNEDVGNAKDDPKNLRSWQSRGPSTLPTKNKTGSSSTHSVDSLGGGGGSNATTPRKSAEQQHQQQYSEIHGDFYNQTCDEFAPHCSTEIEVFIPEMSQLVIQVYHNRQSVVARFHNSANAEAMQVENRTVKRAELDEYQLESRGQLSDVLLAETILPVHLLNRGIRCARMRCLETGSVSTLLMLKIGELHDVTATTKTAKSTATQQQQQSHDGLRSELSMLLSGAENDATDDAVDHEPKDLATEFSL